MVPLGVALAQARMAKGGAFATGEGFIGGSVWASLVLLRPVDSIEMGRALADNVP